MRYPAFISDSVRTSSSNANSHDMGTRVEEFSHTLMNRFKNTRTCSNHTRKFIHRHRTNQFSVRDPCPIIQLDRLILRINLYDFGIQQKLVLWQSLCDGFPDTSRATMGRESESGVGTPIPSRFVQDDVLGHRFEVWCSDTFTEPLTLHTCRWYSPYFEIVRTHEQICNSVAYKINPLSVENGRRAIPIIRTIHSSKVLGF